MRGLSELVRDLQPVPTTARAVAAIEYRLDGLTWFSQLEGLEGHDGTMWLVCGIHEPLRPWDPWPITYAGRRGAVSVLREPPLWVPQGAVTRVYDGIDDA